MPDWQCPAGKTGSGAGVRRVFAGASSGGFHGSYPGVATAICRGDIRSARLGRPNAVAVVEGRRPLLRRQRRRRILAGADRKPGRRYDVPGTLWRRPRPRLGAARHAQPRRSRGRSRPLRRVRASIDPRTLRAGDHGRRRLGPVGAPAVDGGGAARLTVSCRLVHAERGRSRRAAHRAVPDRA